jgi:tetratricopeptide (TPR) repeat protein
MDSKTSRYLQQAGKYVMLGKLTLALEQYLKLHEMKPDDTTILNNIGDLYVRLDDKENALVWYTKLAETFAFRQQLPNAVATYRKILKLVPKDQEAIMQLALLYERQEEKNSARSLYQMLAKHKRDLGELSESIALFQKVCQLDPECAQSFLELAQNMELTGKNDEAVRFYLKSATLFVHQDKKADAIMVTENIFRIRPQNRDMVKAFLKLLQKVDLTVKGIEYLQSVGLIDDSEFRLIVTEVLLEEDDLETAKRMINENVRQNAVYYEPAVKLLKALIFRKDLSAAMDLLESILDISIQMKDEITMRVILDNLAELDEGNVRILKTLTTIMIRMNDKLNLETYLKRLITLQLRDGNFRDARESLNKLVVYGQADYYLDLLNLMNEASASPVTDLSVVTNRVVRAFESGGLDKEEDNTEQAMALGVYGLDLGIGGQIEVEEEFFLNPTD